MSVPTQIIVNRQAAVPSPTTPVGPTRWDDAGSAYPVDIKQGVRHALDALYRDGSEWTQLAVDDARALGAAHPGCLAYIHPAMGMGLPADGIPVAASSTSKFAYVYSLAANKLRVDQTGAEALRPLRTMVGTRPVMENVATSGDTAGSMRGSLPSVGNISQFDIFLNAKTTANGNLITIIGSISTGANAEFVTVGVSSGFPQLIVRNPPTGAAVVTTLTSTTPFPTAMGTYHAQVDFVANTGALYFVAADGTVTTLIAPATLSSPAVPGGVNAGSLTLRLGGNGGSRRWYGQMGQVLIRTDLAQTAAARAGMTATLPLA